MTAKEYATCVRYSAAYTNAKTQEAVCLGHLYVTLEEAQAYATTLDESGDLAERFPVVPGSLRAVRRTCYLNEQPLSVYPDEIK